MNLVAVGCLDMVTSRHLRAVARRLDATMDGGLVGAYVCGSALLGDFHPGRSDVDMLVVCSSSLGVKSAKVVAAAVRRACLTWAVDLDLNVMTADAAAASCDPWYELHMNTSAGIERLTGEEPVAPWLHIYTANCRRYGAALAGPPPCQLFAPVSRIRLLELLLEQSEMDSTWRAQHVQVLNACRSWRYLSEDEFCSRTAAGEWALPRLRDRTLVSACLEHERDGPGRQLDQQAIDQFRAMVASLLRQALER